MTVQKSSMHVTVTDLESSDNEYLVTLEMAGAPTIELRVKGLKNAGELAAAMDHVTSVTYVTKQVVELY